jgi:hypothetical protein
VLKCEVVLTPLNKFPGIRFHPGAQLVSWHPTGVFDDALADRVIDFIESEERLDDEPFHRFTDFSGLTEIRLTFGHISQIARRRRSGYTGPEVKSAFFCEWVFGLGMARTYEVLMEGGPIHVRAFCTREGAAEWLGVPAHLLQPVK